MQGKWEGISNPLEKSLAPGIIRHHWREFVNLCRKIYLLGRAKENTGHSKLVYKSDTFSGRRDFTLAAKSTVESCGNNPLSTKIFLPSPL
jgi:hypothetical protein